MKTIKEAAAIFEVSQAGIWGLIRQGKIKSKVIRRPEAVLVSIAEIRALFDREPETEERLKAYK